jgi:hypothetical protein
MDWNADGRGRRFPIRRGVDPAFALCSYPPMETRTPFDRLDELERRHDGPFLPADPLTHALPAAPARSRLFDRLAAEATGEAARRRARLTAAHAEGDRRLADLGRSLAFYRGQGVGWRQPANR